MSAPKYIDGRRVYGEVNPPPPLVRRLKYREHDQDFGIAPLEQAVDDFAEASSGPIRLDASGRNDRPRNQGLDRWIWRLKQLLPLTYRTTYAEDGKRHFTVWRMWFGRCFDVDDVVVGLYYDPGPIDAPGVLVPSEVAKEWATAQGPDDLRNLFSWLEHKIWGPLGGKAVDEVHEVVRAAGMAAGQVDKSTGWESAKARERVRIYAVGSRRFYRRAEFVERFKDADPGTAILAQNLAENLEPGGMIELEGEDHEVYVVVTMDHRMMRF